MQMPRVSMKYFTIFFTGRFIDLKRISWEMKLLSRELRKKQRERMRARRRQKSVLWSRDGMSVKIAATRRWRPPPGGGATARGARPK
jgi:hypothetical protein